MPRMSAWGRPHVSSGGLPRIDAQPLALPTSLCDLRSTHPCRRNCTSSGADAQFALQCLRVEVMLDSQLDCMCQPRFCV